MPLQACFQALRNVLKKLQDALEAMHLTVVTDKPAKGDVALVDQFGYAAVEVVDWLREATAAAGECADAAGRAPLEFDRVLLGLATCQERFHRISRRLLCDLDAEGQIEELAGFGRQRGGEWMAWTLGVRTALSGCRIPLQDASQALSVCWQEIAERAGTQSVTVRTRSVGQQIVAVQPETRRRRRVPSAK